MGLLSIYQHKQDVCGWICINSHPNAFPWGWVSCLTCLWGPLGPHNTTAASIPHCNKSQDSSANRESYSNASSTGKGLGLMWGNRTHQWTSIIFSPDLQR